ncbi:hypothetical protein Tco_1555983 [Tanacetum coccineum]
MRVFLFRCAWKKALNLLKKGLLVREEAMEASKRRRSMLDYRIQQLYKEKKAGNVQTSLTLSSTELEIQSMVDVPIHQEDLVVQRTPLIDTVILMVTEKTASTPTPPTTQAQVQMCLTSCWKDNSREAWNALLVAEKQRWTNDHFKGQYD